ncbi:hypothetical protein GTP23_07555 [Pseudoduganella sp. FT93W]|uniref:DNA-binding response regulator n=1 Tax=Duganella fentianensis TaxID=2692177 RepID=A0A845HV87_9BURK|nr:hypothetical protein [Duganella fentianensis]MYN44923.1 hypothetical protein [Duganella fentianensis]
MSAAINVILVADDPDLRTSLAQWTALHGIPICAVCKAAEFYPALPAKTEASLEAAR